VLVALTGSADGERLIRRAARIAQRAKGDLVGVHVSLQDGLAAPSAELLESQRVLLEELGGTYHEVAGEDAGQALVETARALNATQIVMGASRRSRWERLTRGSVIGSVIRQSDVGIDVHVVSHPPGTVGIRSCHSAAGRRHFRTAGSRSASRWRWPPRRCSRFCSPGFETRSGCRASCSSSCCSWSASRRSGGSGRR
jgi:K+-sensing histidine kinase KdpD